MFRPWVAVIRQAGARHRRADEASCATGRSGISSRRSAQDRAVVRSLCRLFRRQSGTQSGIPHETSRIWWRSELSKSCRPSLGGYCRPVRRQRERRSSSGLMRWPQERPGGLVQTLVPRSTRNGGAICSAASRYGYERPREAARSRQGRWRPLFDRGARCGCGAGRAAQSSLGQSCAGAMQVWIAEFE